MPKLDNDKYERFCEEYHIDLNRVEAVIRSGCWQHKDKYSDEMQVMDRTNREHRLTASCIASRLMLKPEIIIRVNELEAARNQHCRLEATRVVEWHRHIVFDFTPEDEPTWNHQLAAANQLAKFMNMFAEDDNRKAKTLAAAMKEILQDGDDDGSEPQRDST